jgi:hypothetical protein
MITFLIWWFVGALFAVGANYVLMQFTDDESD